MTDTDRASRRDAPTSASRRSPGAAPLAVADGLALLVFVAAGLRSHDIGAVGEIAARNAIPLALAWVVTALVVGVYRRRDLSSLVLTWAVAVPSALLVRTWWVGSPRADRVVVFLVVGVVFTAMFLAVGRCVVWAATRSRPVWRRPV
jgi:Ca2+/Na+ antiporter